MAFRYLIYSTGTTYADTIIRESLTNNPGVNEASLYTDFIIPAIQPLYLWRVTGGTDVVPNTDLNIYNYSQSIAPPLSPDDNATVGYVTGLTDGKINKVTGITNNLGVFNVEGNLVDGGYTIPELTGLTTYTFVESGSTQITQVGNTITIYTTEPTGTTVSWGNITGTLSDQTDLWNTLTNISGDTASKLDAGVFTGYTANTETRLQGIEGDITILSADTTYISGVTDSNFSIFTGYTATTQPIIDSALTGATNGLSVVGRNIELGGILTKDTTISGITRDFTLNVGNLLIQTTGNLDIIDSGGNGINIESDAGNVELIGSDINSIAKTKLSISDVGMTITDSRTTPSGLEYAANYSATFTPRSLVDKAYVDSVGSGLIPKAAVLVATTSNIDLTGGTFISGSTIDGVVISDGDRVLVKDQTDATQNGIWVYSGGSNVFYRSNDFNGSPDGEISSGNIIPVITGDTNYNTLWVLVTPNPITLGTTNLEFTLFSSPHELISGTGITINGNVISVNGVSLAGSSIKFTGNTFNVDPTTGNLAVALGNKLDVVDFNTYTGITNNRLNGIESDILTLSADTTYISGVTDSNFSIFTGYTASTETRLQGIESDVTGLSAITANKLDAAVFTGYTASTAPNEIFLIHTGGTEINVITPVAIDWDDVEVSGSSFLWSGGSDIYIKESGDYEISYNIPFTSNTSRNIGIGSNIIKNNSEVIDVTASGMGSLTDSGVVGSLTLPAVILTLTQNDKLTLAAFRTGKSGSVITQQTGSILIRKRHN